MTPSPETHAETLEGLGRQHLDAAQERLNAAAALDDRAQPHHIENARAQARYEHATGAACLAGAEALRRAQETDALVAIVREMKAAQDGLAYRAAAQKLLFCKLPEAPHA
jgi:hypothetical protein